MVVHRHKAMRPRTWRMENDQPWNGQDSTLQEVWGVFGCDLNVKGGEVKLYCNPCDGLHDSIDVRFTKACDNNCAFCIEREGLKSLGNTDVKKMAEAALETGIKSMLILGGEPFLLPDKLLEFVKLVRGGFNEIYITTSLPKTFIDNLDKCGEIVDIIDGLNVSVQSVDSVENNAIFKASSRHCRLSVLKGLNALHSDKIRTSINLVRGGIDSSTKISRSLCALYAIGCRHVKINELQDAGDLYVSYEGITGAKLKSPYSHGCQFEIKPFQDMRLTLKRSCFITERSLKASIGDAAKVGYKALFFKPENNFKVLYEDGTIKNKWEKGTVSC